MYNISIVCTISALYCTISALYCTISALYCTISALYCTISALYVQYQHCTVQYQHCTVQYQHCTVQYQHCTVQYQQCTVQYQHYTVKYQHCTVQYHIVLNNISTVLYNISTILYNISTVLYNINIVLYNITTVLYNISTVLYNISIVVYNINDLQCPHATTINFSKVYSWILYTQCYNNVAADDKNYQSQIFRENVFHMIFWNHKEFQRTGQYSTAWILASVQPLIDIQTRVAVPLVTASSSHALTGRKPVTSHSDASLMSRCRDWKLAVWMLNTFSFTRVANFRKPREDCWSF